MNFSVLMSCATSTAITQNFQTHRFILEKDSRESKSIEFCNKNDQKYMGFCCIISKILRLLCQRLFFYFEMRISMNIVYDLFYCRQLLLQVQVQRGVWSVGACFFLSSSAVSRDATQTGCSCTESFRKYLHVYKGILPALQSRIRGKIISSDMLDSSPVKVHINFFCVDIHSLKNTASD